MSEYQYYEFLALDRRLTTEQIDKLRAFSTRARITSTSFVNEYQWGDFKGDVNAWMDKYFDAFLYFANWGTNIFKVGLSSRLLDAGTAELYCASESASVRESGGKTIISFHSEDDEIDEWPDESDALSALIPIRAQLTHGDLRSLYLGWLLCAQTGELEDEDLEPPVPPGLADLDGSLDRLVDFLRIDKDLLEIAAAASAPLVARGMTREAVRKWIAGRLGDVKDDYLARFIAAEEPALAAELQRLIGHQDGPVPTSPIRRPAGALLEAARELGDKRRRAAAAQAAMKKIRRQQEAAQARSKYLVGLAQREPAVWGQIDRLIATKNPANYDRALVLLADLREIATTQTREPDFLVRLAALRTEHARKPSLLQRMQRAGLA
ncbi:MAG: hypothetical protein JWO56_3640 [Acidobacteria bacterium]|nr:hypothetical protein [Acidobacteriota bacterium]